MNKKWTEAQDLAISQKGKTLLISAAAGSGKTATLTERIVRSLTDENSPSDISRLLIVTFTRLAATELKQRISAAISAEIAKNPHNKHLSKQMIMLESAKICTIDSFYLDIVRSNFQRIGLPSGFRIGDEGELALLRKNIMEELLEEKYDSEASENSSFANFVENFVEARNSDNLSDIFLDLEDKLSSRPDGIDSLISFSRESSLGAKSDFFESSQGKIIREYANDAFLYYSKALLKSCNIISSDEDVEKAYLSSFSYDRQFCEGMLEALTSGTYVSAREKILSYSPITLKALKGHHDEAIENIKAIRKKFSTFVKEKCQQKLFSYSQEEISAMMERSSDVIDILYDILKEFSERLLAEKFRRKVFDFKDIRSFALRILSDENGAPSEIAVEYSKKYDEIYIDEYQDVDPVQDLIFRLIARPNNRFMVGDIKQSIYSFRGADPEIFAQYKRSFPHISESGNSDTASIFMSNNFRCDKNIIDYTNRIFSYVFGNCGDSIGYSKEDDLIFSKVEEGRTLPSPIVNIAIITPNDASEDDADINASNITEDDTDPEALYIAREIDRLIKEEVNADGTKIEPRDIAVIMRSSTAAPKIADALSLFSIPCADNSKKDFFETPDVMLVLSLLSAIDNPQKDIPLAAVLYSPFFGYTMDDLIEIRKATDPSYSLFEALKNYKDTASPKTETAKKNEYFLEKLELYRNFANISPIDKLIKFIYRDLSVMSFAYGTHSNLRKLYDLSRKFEAGSFKGLNNFIGYINALISENKIPSSPEDDSASNTVKLISAHKSKGLEFPVCFVCGTQSLFNADDRKGNLLYSYYAGIGLKLVHKSGLAKINTPMREAVSLSIEKNQAEEEMRILYVALTRARERLYITAKTRSRYEKLLQKAYMNYEFTGKFGIASCNCWLDWILASSAPEFSGKEFEISHFTKKDIIDINTRQDSDTEQITLSEDPHLIAVLKERFDFVYPFSHLNMLPAKLSVSRLSPNILDDPDSDSVSLSEPDISEICGITDFLDAHNKAGAAEKGSATHLFMQFCNFENSYNNGVEKELSRLVSEKFIPEQLVSLINTDQLRMFFESDFYTLIKDAKKVYREQRFNIMLPASHFTQDKELASELENEKILVQGVIDLFFITASGELILCDYKTDHLSPKEIQDPELARKKLTERHKEQLTYYAMALHSIFGKYPDRVFIYSLPLGNTIEIKIDI